MILRKAGFSDGGRSSEGLASEAVRRCTSGVISLQLRV